MDSHVLLFAHFVDVCILGVGFLCGKMEILDDTPPFQGSYFTVDVTGPRMLVC
jgi:hypothetical protein